MRGPFLHALKSATQALHQQVDAVAPLARKPLRREDYVEHLCALAGFQIPLEEHLFKSFPWDRLGLPEASARQRAEALVADLSELGIDAREVPRCLALPQVTSLGEALGCLYVLEGSTLGGQLLARMLEDALPGPLPLGYLRGAGEATGARWKSFCEFAERLAAEDGTRIEPALHAARATFASLATWLTVAGDYAPSAGDSAGAG